MPKLTFTEKKIARGFKYEIAEMGGGIFYNALSGVSVVIVPNDKMMGFVRVYVAHCSPKDKFSKKRARLVLSDRFWNDNYILWPLNGLTYSALAEEMCS